MGSRKGVDAFLTKELKWELRDLGKSDQGSRQALMKRYEACRRDPGEEEEGDEIPVEGDCAAPHASENPMMVVLDKATGNKYLGAVPHKGLGGDGDKSWLIKDMHQ